jgi:hypothetical protein
MSTKKEKTDAGLGNVSKDFFFAMEEDSEGKKIAPPTKPAFLFSSDSLSGY